MTKEEYLIIREEEEVPLSLFYSYYIDLKTIDNTDLSFEEFEQMFARFIRYTDGARILTNTGLRYITLDRILEKIYSYYNSKFELI